MELLIQILGWIGTALVISAYFLVSYKRISPTSSLYQVLNLLGVIGVGISVYHKGAWSALTLQIVWGVIAFISLARIRRNQM
jgi:hypothetical protein